MHFITITSVSCTIQKPNNILLSLVVALTHKSIIQATKLLQKPNNILLSLALTHKSIIQATKRLQKPNNILLSLALTHKSIIQATKRLQKPNNILLSLVVALIHKSIIQATKRLQTLLFNLYFSLYDTSELRMGGIANPDDMIFVIRVERQTFRNELRECLQSLDAQKSRSTSPVDNCFQLIVVG